MLPHNTTSVLDVLKQVNEIVELTTFSNYSIIDSLYSDNNFIGTNGILDGKRGYVPKPISNVTQYRLDNTSEIKSKRKIIK